MIEKKIKVRQLKNDIGFIYFIVNNQENKVYVGETTNFSRVKKYNEVYKNKKVKGRCCINNELLSDLLSDDIEFSIYYFETPYHKKLERIYINYLFKNHYALYNKINYKVKYTKDDIDEDFLKEIGLEPNILKEMWFELNRGVYVEGAPACNVYLGDGLYVDKEGNIIEYE